MNGMKTLLLKSVFLLAAFVMIDYLIMIIVGCVSGIIGFSADYYECTFCEIGKTLLLISSIVFIAIIAPDIKSVIKSHWAF